MKHTSLSAVRKRKLLFYLSIIILPMIQFFIFYVVVNANTFILALQRYEYADNGELISTFVWFKNIGQVFKDFATLELFKFAIKNSLLAYVIGLLFGTVFSLFFSYYIFKKCPLANTFKILLYLPNIVSVMALSVMFRLLVNRGIPNFANRLDENLNMMGFLTNPDIRFATIMFFCILTGFGSNVLIYAGTMSGISPSILEAAQVDGVNSFQEFFLIVRLQLRLS